MNCGREVDERVANDVCVVAERRAAGGEEEGCDGRGWGGAECESVCEK